MAGLVLMAGSSHPLLAQKISRLLKIPLGLLEIKTFANGEIYVKVGQEIAGADVFLIQTSSSPVNKNLMELLITIDALKRAGAGRLNLVCPLLCYSRQDRQFNFGEPVSSQLVANLISRAGADRLITVDLHAERIAHFYRMPVENLAGYPLFTQYLLKQRLKNPLVVSPDVGAKERGVKMAALLKAPLALAEKTRVKHNQVESMWISGEIKGKTAIVLDDMIDTGGTAAEVTRILKEKGAKKIILCATHGLLSDPAIERLKNCPASLVLLLDTVPVPSEKKIAKIKIISSAPLLAKVIKKIHRRGQGKSGLFR